MHQVLHARAALNGIRMSSAAGFLQDATLLIPPAPPVHKAHRRRQHGRTHVFFVKCKAYRQQEQRLWQRLVRLVNVWAVFGLDDAVPVCVYARRLSPVNLAPPRESARSKTRKSPSGSCCKVFVNYVHVLQGLHNLANPKRKAKRKHQD